MRKIDDDPFPFPFSKQVIFENYNSWIQVDSFNNVEVKFRFFQIHGVDYIKYIFRSSVDGSIVSYGIAKAMNNLFCDINQNGNICFGTIMDKVVFIEKYQLQCE